MTAPKGNTNPLKHGLYAQQFTENQRLGLRKMAWDDFRHEEFLHRSIGAELFKLLRALLAEEQPDLDLAIKLAGFLAKNTLTTVVSARTHALLNPPDDAEIDPLEEALDIEPFDIPEPEK